MRAKKKSRQDFLLLCVCVKQKKKKRKNQSSCVGLERSASIVIKDKPIGYKKKEGKGIDHNYHEKGNRKTTTITRTPCLTYLIDMKRERERERKGNSC